MRTKLSILLALALAGALVAVPGSQALDVPGPPKAALVEGTAPGTVTIFRDAFGVPHVVGETNSDVAFGAGYATAQDRLWQAHFLRLVTTGRLSELLGPVVLDMDVAVRRTAFSTEERAARLQAWRDSAAGEYVHLLDHYTDGINAWIEEVRANPTLLPAEFVHYGVGVPEPWDVLDSVAMIDYMTMFFGGPGGGEELANLSVLLSLAELEGDGEITDDVWGMFNDVRWRNDPAAPTTLPAADDPNAGVTTTGTAPRMDAIEVGPGPKATPVQWTPVAAEHCTPGHLQPGAVHASAPLSAQEIAAMARALEETEAVVAETSRGVLRFGSNAVIVGDEHTPEDGHTLLLGGPQVGHFVPGVFSEIALHATGPDSAFDSSGVSFPGVGPGILLGTGRGYAFTSTTGASDQNDIYLLLVRENPGGEGLQECFQGEWHDLDARTETFTFRGLPIADHTFHRTTTRGNDLIVLRDDAIGSGQRERLEAGEAVVVPGNRFSHLGRELEGTATGWFGLTRTVDMDQFFADQERIVSSHNSLYADDRGNIAWVHTGLFPIRETGAEDDNVFWDRRLPVRGDGYGFDPDAPRIVTNDPDDPREVLVDGHPGYFEWKGFLPFEAMPQFRGTNAQGWATNWNNKPRPTWNSGDGSTWGLSHAVRWLDERIADHVARGTLSLSAIEDVNRFAAFQSRTMPGLLPILLDTLERAAADGLLDERAGRAHDVLREWGAQEPPFTLEDRRGDGRYDSAGPAIVDEWRARAFADVVRRHFPGISIRTPTSVLVHFLEGAEASVPPSRDYLRNRPADEVLLQAFDRALDALAAEFGNDDPATWRRQAPTTHFDHLNSFLFVDQAARNDFPWGAAPGTVEPIPFMNRGSYNLIAELGTGIGAARGRGLSVNPPGASGFVSVTGREDPHFRDQYDLYLGFRYKPMSVDPADAAARAQRVEVVPTG